MRRFTRVADPPVSSLQPGQQVPTPSPLPPAVKRGSRKFPDTFPLHLTASTTLQSNSVAGVNAVALKNPLGQAMEIMEIKWSLIQRVTNQANLGGVIGCKLDLGKYSLTNGFVPVWGFGRPPNVYAEIATTGPFIGESEDVTIGFATINEYCWKLPYPLYVPAGAVLLPTFQHRGLIKQDVDARISYSARSFPAGTPPPDRLAIPWAAPFYSNSIDINAAGTSQSKETDLVNMHAEPVILQRVTGAIQLYNVTTSPFVVTEAADVDDNDAAGEAVANFLYNVRLVDSFGRPLIRNLTPFRLAFSPLTRSWETTGAVMDPNSYWQAFIRKDAPTSPSVSNVLSQATITIVGHRFVVGGDV